MKKSWMAIWTEIAEAFDTPYGKRTPRQDDIAPYGLCKAISRFGTNRPGIIHFLRPRIGIFDYWWELGEIGNNYRATFAGLMAAMGDKDFESFLKWCEDHP